MMNLLEFERYLEKNFHTRFLILPSRNLQPILSSIEFRSEFNRNNKRNSLNFFINKGSYLSECWEVNKNYCLLIKSSFVGEERKKDWREQTCEQQKENFTLIIKSIFSAIRTVLSLSSAEKKKKFLHCCFVIDKNAKHFVASTLMHLRALLSSKKHFCERKIFSVKHFCIFILLISVKMFPHSK